MSYNLKSISSDRVVLKREKTTLGTTLFTGVGLLFIGIGLTLFVVVDDEESKLNFFKYITIIMGSISVGAGLNFSRQIKKTIPKWVIFNNQKGYVQVQMSDDELSSGYIPYEEISHFYVKEEVEHSSSTSTRSINNRIYSYHVLLQKKDEGQWYLYKSSSEIEANKILEALTANVKLDKHSLNVPKPCLSEKIQMDSTHSKSTIRWRNSVSIMQPIFLIGFCTLFLFVGKFILGSFMELGMDNGFVYVVLGFIGLVFLFVMFMTVKKMVKDYRTFYVFTITKDAFIYEEEDMQGNTKKSEKVQLTDIGGVSFSFNPAKGYQTSGSLNVNAKKDESKVESAVDRIKHLLGGSAVSMDLSDLNVVEKLELDRWIKVTIMEKAGIEIL
ncbi:MAG: hypothetical protein NT150_02190 [Bacteroidetes bacterium]|nr:hypothetical protein [Bacteroidota bacterium]